MKTVFAYMAVALIDITVIVCFTQLAIHFGHWWIALFAYFFLFKTESEELRKGGEHE